MKMFDKQGREMDLPGLVILVVGGLIVWQFFGGGGLGFGTTTPGTPGTPSTVNVNVEPGCQVADTTLTLGPQEEAFNPTTSIDAGLKYVLYKINGVVQNGGTSVADSTTTTVNPKDTVELVYAYNSSEDVTPGTGYVSAYQSFTVPCLGSVRSAAIDAGAYKIYDNMDLSGTTAIKCYDTSNDLITTGTSDADIAAGDVVTLKCEIRGVYEDAFSPEGFIFAVEYNVSGYDKAAITRVRDRTVTSIGCPSYLKVDSTANSLGCYEVSKGIISNEIVDFDLLLDTKSTWSPANQTTGGASGTLTFFLEDKSLYLNEDSTIKTGYMDFDGNNVGTLAKTVNETVGLK